MCKTVCSSNQKSIKKKAMEADDESNTFWSNLMKAYLKGILYHSTKTRNTTLASLAPGKVINL